MSEMNQKNLKQKKNKIMKKALKKWILTNLRLNKIYFEIICIMKSYQMYYNWRCSIHIII